MEKRYITVNKTASVKVAPNKAIVHIRTAGESKLPEDAMFFENNISDGLKRIIEDYGEGKILFTMSGIHLSRIVRDGKTAGYKATRDCAIELDYDGKKLMEILDGIRNSGEYLSVEFTYEDEKLRAELLKKAVTDARADAELIASAAGVKIIELERAEYSPCCAQPMLLRAAPANADSDDVANPQPVTVSESVTCSWSVE